ncbi:MAG: electron transport complex subunit RsxG [Gammaproteobacteria bacterium]|nr:electron transport complex subunit RsxG [Gammaproteobacteria bacterium]
MSERPVWKSGVTLAVIAAVCTAMVALTWQLTADRIEKNKTEWLERSLQPALAGLFFDSGVTESMLVIPQPHELPGKDAAIVYRVYAADKPVAALFVVTARDGYAGPIRLLIGIEMDGTVTGVRVLEHRETPGLGDRIETGKSDWVLQFDGRSLLAPEPARWAIKGDGGDFDQLTGASVTPRAIIKAIRQTLLYFEGNVEAIFAAESSEEETD